MPRIARIVVPGHPHHITQRGNNRSTTFFDDQDRLTYLKLLNKYSTLHALQIWAYCLMDNHVHILAVPEKQESLSRGVRLTIQVYTQYLNRKLKQSGRIWQNRFFSCIVEEGSSLWTVVRYIERNPLKIGLVEKPEHYRWSSAKAHIEGTADPILTKPSWLSQEDRKSYTEFAKQQNEQAENLLRKATRAGRPYGADTFIAEMENQLRMALTPRKPGRPCKRTGERP